MKEIMELLKKRDYKALLYDPTENALLQLLRYSFAGGGATVVDWASLYILHSLLSVPLYISVAAAFCFGLIVNYVLSRLLVFKISGKISRAAEFAVYFITGLIGLGLTEGLMFVFCNLLDFHYIPSKIIVTVLVLAWNFGSKKLILYRKSGTK